MSSKSILTAAQDLQLMSDVFACAEDPHAFVLFAFPWGKKGTPLENFTGPRKWQAEELMRIRDHIRRNKNRERSGLTPEVYRSATASGRGIGKSALVAWLCLWNFSTHLGSATVVAANTEDQLKSKTWGELGKWAVMALNSHWYDVAATSIKAQEWFKQALSKQLKLDDKYYYVQAQLWNEDSPDSFAGLHNQAGMVLIFDEASGIPAPIWKVSEGFFTDPVLHRYWFCFSNPRRNTGAFFECFHKNRNFWLRRNLDSRTVEGTDLSVYKSIIDQYGEDSDEARVEVKGEFPRQGDRQFISREIVNQALDRGKMPNEEALVKDDYAPIYMGVDPARFGDDSTVIRFRQGRNGKIIPPTVLKGADNMEVANICASLIQKYNPDVVCVDAGNGTGVIDRLREMGFKVHEVWFGAKSPEPEYANMRTYLWGAMREWLKGACIDDRQELIDDLCGPEYKFMGTSDVMRLETKEELKKKGLSSPDHADALACTFAVKIARQDLKTAKKGRGRGPQVRDTDYNIFS